MTHYGDEVEYWMQEEISPEYTKERLDEIKVAGSVRLGILLRCPGYHLRWWGRAVRILTDDEAFRVDVMKILDESVEEELQRLRKESGRQDGLDGEEIRTLVGWKILRQLQQEETYTEVCELFKIPKDLGVSRLIMNAKKANARSKDPPKFSLATCEEVRQRMLELGPCWTVSGDLRHWFYQISITKNFRRLLTVLARAESGRGQKIAYEVRVLPMGHQWSPWLAQSVTWGVVLCNANLKVRGPEKGGGGDPRAGDPREGGILSNGHAVQVNIDEHSQVTPDFLELVDTCTNEVVGFITVYIDNILVVARDKGLAEWWRRKLYDNAKLVNAQWKIPKDGSAVTQPRQEVEFIGVHYWWEGNELCWEWPEKERMAWEKENVWEESGSKWSPRKIYSWLGIRLWKARIAEIPFFVIEEAMNMIAVIQAWAKEDHWDCPLSEPRFAEVREALWRMRLDILTREIMRREARVEDDKIYVVTDACIKTGLAVVWMNSDGSIGDIYQHEYRAEEKQHRMFAVRQEVIAIKEAVSRTNAKGVTIRLGSDALSAIQAIKKGWSRSEAMRREIKEIYEILWMKRNRLVLFHVPGVDNVADAPSRFYTAERQGGGKKVSAQAWYDEEDRKRRVSFDIVRGRAVTKWEGRCKGY